MSSTETPTSISNDRMNAFIETIATQARTAMLERSDDILKAWHENIGEAQENKKDFPPLKLAISATVDLGGGKIETAIRFTATYTSTLSSALPDPDQPEFGFDSN